MRNALHLPLTPSEAFHSYQSSALLRLSVAANFENAAWLPRILVADLLSVVEFCHAGGDTPETCWPLRPDCDADLSWLRMVQGRNYLRQMARLHLPEAVLQKLLPPPKLTFLTPTEVATASTDLPGALTDFLDLNDPAYSPYRSVAAQLVQCISSANRLYLHFSFFDFVITMNDDFKTLLYQKDERALLLFAIWYAKLGSTGIWWTSRRADLEFHAICIFLEKRHGNVCNAVLTGLIDFTRVLRWFPYSSLQVEEALQQLDWLSQHN
jgi:hypothetical protein